MIRNRRLSRLLSECSNSLVTILRNSLSNSNLSVLNFSIVVCLYVAFTLLKTHWLLTNSSILLYWTSMNTTYQPQGDGEVPSSVPELQSGVGQPTQRLTHKFKYISKSKCKRFALEFAKANRAHKFTRVSEEFLIACEANLRNFIQSRIKSHPSKGKTLL